MGAIQNVRSQAYILNMGNIKNEGAPFLNLHAFLHLKCISIKSQFSLISLKHISFQEEDPICLNIILICLNVLDENGFCKGSILKKNIRRFSIV